jgi:hypothetical protein
MVLYGSGMTALAHLVHNIDSEDRTYFLKSNENLAVTFTLRGKHERVIELWDLKDLEAAVRQFDLRVQT